MERLGYRAMTCACGKRFYVQTEAALENTGLCCPACTDGTEENILRAGKIEKQLRMLMAEHQQGSREWARLAACLGQLLQEVYSEPVPNSRRAAKLKEARLLLSEAAVSDA